MARYRVGDRVFETEAGAQAHRASLPDAPPLFLEPDAPAPTVDPRAGVERAAAAPWASLPWVFAGVWLVVDVGLRIFFVQTFLGGRAPPLGGVEVLGYLLRLASVWRVAYVLGSPSAYSKWAVYGTAALAVVALFSLGSRVVTAVRLAHAYRAYQTATAALRPAHAPAEAPAVVAAPLPDVPDADPPPVRTWVAFHSDECRYAVSFPGTPALRDRVTATWPGAGCFPPRSEHELTEVVTTPDGAEFAVAFAETGRAAGQPTRRTTGDVLALLVTSRHATMLQQTERYDDAAHVAERDARLALVAPPRILYARIVSSHGATWVATADIPAGQADGDARVFLESFAPDADPGVAR